MDRILVFGAGGFLGSRLFGWKLNDYKFIGTVRKQVSNEINDTVYFNALDTNKLRLLVEEVNPSIIFNCIALTDVDNCESEPDLADTLNSTFPFELAKISYEMQIKFIHFSTDHFESNDFIPRKENSRVWSINKYGASKLKGEENIKKINSNALIIRTNFFGYEIYTNNLLSKIKNTLESGDSFGGFSDVYFSPVSISELINATFNLVKINVSGNINIASNETISKFDFAKLVARNLNISESKITPTFISKSNLLTARPNYLALDNSLYKKMVNLNLKSIDAMLKDELGLYPRCEDLRKG